MVMSPGIAFLPLWSSSNYPEGIKTYESEGESRRARSTLVHTTPGYATVDCRNQIAFKFGVDGPAGWIAAVLERGDKRLVGYLKSVPVFRDRSYSHGCVAEVYKSQRYPYLELELHGPTVTLQPGEQFAIEERQWVADVAALPRSEDEVWAIARG
jgi:hypothetical protein